MDFPGKKIMPRFFGIAILIAVVCVIIVGKAFYIMTVERDYWLSVSERFQKDNVPIPPKRGDILADNGEVLAASIPEYRMYMDFMSGERDTVRVKKDQARRDSILNVSLDSICNGLHEIFPDVEPAKMRQHLLEGRKKESKNWLIYPKRITYIQYQEVKKLPLFRLSAYSGGFHVEKSDTRKNPYGKLAVRTVGDLYKGKDSARSGIELGFDSILRGKPGVSHRQKIFNKYLTIVDEPAQDGYDVQTTLNVTMQDICEKALGDKLRELQAQKIGDVEFGVCVLMEVATGDVKAIVSLSRMKDGTFQEIQNKAISNLMEPGSVFKPMSFLVAFNDGYLGMDDKVNTGCGIVNMHNRPMRDHNWRNGGYGTLTARQCIQQSSNVGVSTFIDRFYGSNPQKFVDGILATGVADDLKIPIPGYAKPQIKRPSNPTWAKTDLPWMSIGYVTQIPPISTLTFYNGIANNGRMMRPRFVKSILHNGEVVRTYDPVVVREHMASNEAVKNIQTCLREVVTLGVGKKAGSKLVHTAGKTGTAQVWSKAGRTDAYLVSFAGFFPYENPKYSCIVCINKTGAASGGAHCGPVFRKVAETVMAQQRLSDYSSVSDSSNIKEPMVCSGNIAASARVLKRLNVNFTEKNPSKAVFVWGTAETTASGVVLRQNEPETGKMPDLTGYGLRDALHCLEQMGLKVKPYGIGHVKKQSIKPGHAFKKGDEVVLTLSIDDEIPELPDSVVKTIVESNEEIIGGNDSLGQVQQVVKKPQPQKPAPKPSGPTAQPKKDAVAPKQQQKDKKPEPQNQQKKQKNAVSSQKQDKDKSKNKRT